jgi:hypothetical protein
MRTVSLSAVSQGAGTLKALLVEVDRGSTSAKQQPAGKVWLVRLRRDGNSVIVNSGLTRTSAEYLANQLRCILTDNPGGLDGGNPAMAQRVMLIDDLDGSEGAETITYSVDGQEYEIDLSEDNAKKFRDTLDKYLKASRRVEAPPPVPVSIVRAGKQQRSSSGGSSTGRKDLAAIRVWAQEQKPGRRGAWPDKQGHHPRPSPHLQRARLHRHVPKRGLGLM